MKKLIKSNNTMRLLTNILCLIGVILCICLLISTNRHIQNSVNKSFTNTIVTVDNKYIDRFNTTHLVLKDINSGNILDIKNSAKYDSYDIGDKIHMNSWREVREDGTEEFVYFFPKDYNNIDDDEER